MATPTYTAEQVDAAVALLADADRVAHAREVVMHAAPGLQRILAETLAEDAYFEEAHDQQMRAIAAGGDAEERLRQIRTLVAEEVRLGMLVGVAVGFQLAHELQALAADGATSTPHPEQED